MTTTTAPITITTVVMNGTEEIEPFSDELVEQIYALNPCLKSLSRVLHKAVRGNLNEERPIEYDTTGQPLAVQPQPTPGSLTHALRSEVFNGRVLLKAKLTNRPVSTLERDQLIARIVESITPYADLVKARRQTVEAIRVEHVARDARRSAERALERKQDSFHRTIIDIRIVEGEKRELEEQLASAREAGAPVKRIEIGIGAREKRIAQLTARFDRERAAIRELHPVAVARRDEHIESFNTLRAKRSSIFGALRDAEIHEELTTGKHYARPRE